MNFFLLSFAFSANTQTNLLDELTGQVITLYRTSHYEESIPFATQALTIAETEFGKQDIRVTKYLNILATLYFQVAKYEHSAEIYQHALSILEENPDIKTTRIGQALNNLATVLKEQGKFIDSENYFKRALDIYVLEYGTNDLNVALCLNNLGELFRTVNRYDEAESCLSQALEIREKHLSPVDSFVAQSRNNLAELYRIQGKFEAAENLFEKGLESASETSSNSLCVATLLNNLAFLFRSQGKYVQAENFYERALLIRKIINGENHPDTAATLNDFAILKQDKGSYNSSKEFYLKAFGIYTNYFGENNERVATVLKNLATLYKTQGRYAQSEEQYIKALKVLERATETNDIYIAELLNDFAIFYRVQEKYSAAEQLYKRALVLRKKILGDGHPVVAQTRNNLAKLYTFQKRYDEAELLYKQTLKTFEKTGGKNHPDVATCLNNFSELYVAQNNYFAAEPLQIRALKIRENIFGTNHPAVATCLNNLAKLYTAQSNYFGAETYFFKALKIREKVLGASHPKTGETLKDIAELFKIVGNHQRAANYFEQALKTVESASGIAGGEDFAVKYRKVQEDICSDYLASLAQLQKSKKYINLKNIFDKAFWATEAARSRRFVDQILQSSAGSEANLSNEDKELEKDIRFQLNALEKLKQKELAVSHEKQKKDYLSRLELQMADVRGKRQSLERGFSEKYPRYMELRKPSAISVEDVQNNLLKEDEIIVSFWIGKKNLFASVIDKNKSKFIAHPIESEKLKMLVNRFRKCLDPNEQLADSETYKKASFLLFNEVWEPFLKKYDLSKVSALYIVPHGALCRVPFDALTSSLRGETFSELDYLLNSVPIVYVPSVRVLRAIRRDELSKRFSNKNREPAALFGDPIYTKEQAADLVLNDKEIKSFEINPKLIDSPLHSTVFSSSIISLPGTREEIAKISKVLYNNSNSNHVFVGKQAQESQIKKMSDCGKLKNYRNLHFATHGLLPKEIVGISEASLILSLFGDKENDGFLTMGEILGLKLDADMIVLSACDTGLISDLRDNQGISDLARAFFFAGTPRVTASLWDIDDDATIDLMKAYYSQLKKRGKKVSTLKALNDSKKALIKDGKFSHPYCWGTFVLIGEWQ